MEYDIKSVCLNLLQFMQLYRKITIETKMNQKQFMGDILAKGMPGNLLANLFIPQKALKQESTSLSKPDEWIPASNVYGAYIKAEGKPDKFVQKKPKKDRKNLCIYCPPEIRGWCCHHEGLVKGFRIVGDDHCEFLDEQTGKCTVYQTRFEKNHDCLTIEEMKKLGTLPRKCPYVQFDSAYQARTDLRLYFNEFEIILKE